MATPLLQQLTDAFRCLPGVGPKSAQRMALHVLERDRTGGQRLAQTLTRAIDTIGHCAQCRTLTEQAVCALCQNPQRDAHTLCVVETPADVLALEQAAHYQGNYFVLGGRLSPLDNIGPKDLGLDQLRERLQTSTIHELILATTTTVEGEATAHYIGEIAAAFDCRITRIAHGVPLGGELDYIDSGTLAHAFAGRHPIPPQ
ncbi:MAG: recombination mediator RecR [Pseudomonadota bacterium]